jgi:hypothetical protein
MVVEVLMLENLLLSCFQVAHIPGALFSDVDGISDKTSSVSSDLLRIQFTVNQYKFIQTLFNFCCFSDHTTLIIDFLYVMHSYFLVHCVNHDKNVHLLSTLASAYHKILGQPNPLNSAWVSS